MKSTTKIKKSNRIELHEISIKPFGRDDSFENNVLVECDLEYNGNKRKCHFLMPLAGGGIPLSYEWISTDEFARLFTRAMEQVKEQIWK